MKINIEYTEKEIMALLIADIRNKLNLEKFDEKSLEIQVKSQQNYKSEWEKASFRATYQHYQA